VSWDGGVTNTLPQYCVLQSRQNFSQANVKTNMNIDFELRLSMLRFHLVVLQSVFPQQRAYDHFDDPQGQLRQQSDHQR